MTFAIHVVPVRCVPARTIASSGSRPRSRNAPANRRCRVTGAGLPRRHTSVSAFEAWHRALVVDLVEPEQAQDLERALRALGPHFVHPARDDALAGEDRRVGLRHFRRTLDRVHDAIVPRLLQEREKTFALLARLLGEVLV